MVGSRTSFWPESCFPRWLRDLYRADCSHHQRHSWLCYETPAECDASLKEADFTNVA